MWGSRRITWLVGILLVAGSISNVVIQQLSINQLGDLQKTQREFTSQFSDDIEAVISDMSETTDTDVARREKLLRTRLDLEAQRVNSELKRLDLANIQSNQRLGQVITLLTTGFLVITMWWLNNT